MRIYYIFDRDHIFILSKQFLLDTYNNQYTNYDYIYNYIGLIKYKTYFLLILLLIFFKKKHLVVRIIFCKNLSDFKITNMKIYLFSLKNT